MTPRTSLAQRLLRAGIPPTLLIDLLDPEGMKRALAGEVTAADVVAAPAPVRQEPARTRVAT